MKKIKSSKIIVPLVFVLFLILGGFTFLYAYNNKVYEMDGPSMAPTINSGDRLKVKAVLATELKHGDIIVFTSPTEGARKLVKRVVGLPGDEINIKGGMITVTKPDKTTYTPYNDNKTLCSSCEVSVNDNSVYVIGDNRPNSLDSRSFGQVSFDAVIGLVK